MANQTDPILSDVSPSFTNIVNYIQSGTNIFNSDIVFQGGFDEQYYIIQNYSGTLPFNFPCSISGTNGVTATIVPHNITGTSPVWISDIYKFRLSTFRCDCISFSKKWIKSTSNKYKEYSIKQNILNVYVLLIKIKWKEY